MSLEEKINKAIDRGKLSLKREGEKYWFNYKLRITFLYWSRNLFDGYQIEIFDKKTNLHLETILI